MASKADDYVIAELLPKPLSLADMNIALHVFIYFKVAYPILEELGKILKA